MARVPVRSTDGSAPVHWVRSRQRQVPDRNHTQVMVGSDMGSDPLLRRLRQEVRLPHRRLRLGEGRVRRQRREAPRHAGGVHAERRRRPGLLRREPGRRLQPPDAGGRQGRHQGRVRRHRLPRGPERRVPHAAAGRRAWERERKRRVQERVRGVRRPAVLLQRGLQHARHVSAVGVLAVLQARLPTLL